MLANVTSGIGTVIDWIGTVLSAIVGADGALAELGPLFAIGISISAIMLGEPLPRVNGAKTVNAVMQIPC